MKNKQVISIVVMCILLSCANGEQMPERKNSDTITTGKTSPKDSVPLKGPVVEADTVNYEYKYFFSNDTISQTLYIMKGVMSKKYQVPEKVEFKLILNDKFGTHPEKRFEGTAVLTSANESFSEKNDINESDYFAADYTFRMKECRLKIRLDIDSYAACIVSTTCIDMKYFLKSYPDYDVMKRVGYSK